MASPIMLKLYFWTFENGRRNKERFRKSSGHFPGPRCHMLKEQYLKIVDF